MAEVITEPAWLWLSGMKITFHLRQLKNFWIYKQKEFSKAELKKKKNSEKHNHSRKLALQK